MNKPDQIIHNEVFADGITDQIAEMSNVMEDKLGEIANAIDRNFTSVNCVDYNFEQANVVDALYRCADGLKGIASAIANFTNAHLNRDIQYRVKLDDHPRR
jgi:hypothetical protein